MQKITVIFYKIFITAEKINRAACSSQIPRFMKNFSLTGKNHLILSDIISMISKLGVSTLAEGVQTKEQLRFLRDAGCDKVQGFLFGKPMPCEHFYEKSTVCNGLEYDDISKTAYYDKISTSSLDIRSFTMDMGRYFADSTGSFLLADRRTVPYMEAPSLPQYVLEQLIAGPQAAGLYPTMPQGTVLLDVNVEDGICSVDFNGDFWENRPLTQRGEQLTLLSVVNTLCALDEVDEVEFYIEGRKPGLYTYLSLAGPFRADLGVVGPIRSELNEFEAVLYLPDADQALLHSL